MLSNLFSTALLAIATLQSHVSASPTDMVPRAAAVSHDGPQVVVDPAGVYMRVTRLHDGSLLGGYAAGDGSNKVLRVTKSTDEGTSWKVIGAVLPFGLPLLRLRVLFHYLVSTKAVFRPIK